MCGFANHISFKNITDVHIRDVEKFIKEKCLGILQKRMSDSIEGECDILLDEQQMLDHFGMYANIDVGLFEFQAGDIVLIKELVEYVKQLVEEKGLQHFRKRLEKKQRKADIKRVKKNNDIDVNDIKSQLLQKIIALFTVANRLNDTTFAVEGIDDNIVRIHNENGGQTIAEVVCIACTDKTKPKKVFYNVNRNGNGSWIMSNFKKHLERTHRLVIENVRLNKVNIDLNSIQAGTGESSLDIKHKPDSNAGELEQNAIENGTMNENGDGNGDASVLITNDDALRCIENTDTDTQAILVNQLSKQITDVMAATLRNNDAQEEMNYILGIYFISIERFYIDINSNKYTIMV